MATLFLALVLACGSERAAVKNLADAPELLQLEPVQSTVEAEVALPAPPYQDAAPRWPAEARVVTLVAEVVGLSLEADGDWHVVIRGDSGATMIVELPDPACGAPEVAQAFADARRAFLRLFQAPRRRYARLRVPVRVRLTGVVYFDKAHGQTGVAPNAVELHPLLSVTRPAAIASPGEPSPPPPRR